MKFLFVDGKYENFIGDNPKHIDIAHCQMNIIFVVGLSTDIELMLV